jgi:hypothetical protein
MSALVWIDRALPVKKFYLQRIAANRRQYQRANRFYGMDQVVDKCALTEAVEASLAVRMAVRSLRKDAEGVGASDGSHGSDGPGGGTAASRCLKSCLPRSWCLPRDENLLAALHHRPRAEGGENEASASKKNAEGEKGYCPGNDERWYIAKPDRGRCGRGIGLFSEPAKLAAAFRAGQLCVVENPDSNNDRSSSSRGNSRTEALMATKAGGSTSVVVQEYISRPLLFRGTGCKFDMRIYVLIKSLSPTLNALVFNEGLVRVATTPYTTPNASNCRIATMHLTNSHINSQVVGHKKADIMGKAGAGLKVEEEKEEEEEEEDVSQTKFTVTDTLQWISEERGVPVADIWCDVCSAVSSAIAAIHPFAALKHATCYGTGDNDNDGRCFQLLGVDVLLDDALRPWVLEINNSPSLNLSTAVDERIKLPLIKSMLAEVFGRQDGGAVDAAASPRFETLELEGDASIAFDAQTSVLECYKRLCGHRPGSRRPLTSTKPARDMYAKLRKKAALVTAEAAVAAADDEDGVVLLWEQVALPSRAECDLSGFTVWIATLATASRMCLEDAVAKVRSVLK